MAIIFNTQPHRSLGLSRGFAPARFFGIAGSNPAGGMEVCLL
jgi:hypothetical protein